MNFSDVDLRYQELKQQYLAASLDAAQFDEQLRAMMVQDNQGRWWAKSRESGDWHYYDVSGNAWVRADPPAASPASSAPVQPQQTSYTSATASQSSDAQPAGYQMATAQTLGVDPGSYSALRTPGPLPELGTGIKVFFYIISFLVPIVGIILFFVYRGKPAQADRSAARLFLILGLVSLALLCVCSLSWMSMLAMFVGNSGF